MKLVLTITHDELTTMLRDLAVSKGLISATQEVCVAIGNTQPKVQVVEDAKYTVFVTDKN